MNNHLALIADLRHTLHHYPELSLQEKETKKRLMQFLRDHTGLEIVEMDGWFYAVKQGRDPDAAGIAFRADMDALPVVETELFSVEKKEPLPYASVYNGVSHKCGHDGHCAVLCGLALELDQILPGRTVYLLFQKAEEIGAGGKLCAELIRKKGIGEVYAFHNLGGYPEGAVVYRRGLTQPASEGLTLYFQGKEAHASDPESGKNPAKVIAETVLYAQTLPEEITGGMALCTVTGVRIGNGDFGISAGEGVLQVTLRAERETDLKKMEEELCSQAEKIARKEGIQISCDVSDYFPETRNHDRCLDRVISAAESLGIPAMEMKELWRASEDFGYCLQTCPGAMFYIGNGENWPALHTAEYDFNDAVLENAVRMFLRLCYN